MSSSYPVPTHPYRGEIEIARSRFIVMGSRAEDVEQAKLRINAVRIEMPDASHHVYAYRVGYGNSVTEGMSDDGEPSGTAAPPILAVLRGSGIGDILLVVTRYFGGTKLGTGGLVRAYSDAARLALSEMKTEMKVTRVCLSLTIPYPLYDSLRMLFAPHLAEVLEETFTESVSVLLKLPEEQAPAFIHACTERSNGRVVPSEVAIPPSL